MGDDLHRYINQVNGWDDNMVAFHCFRDSKCEWIGNNLRGFVEQYNQYFETAYELEDCLDVSERNRKQPEVLLKCPDQKDMVIEAKKITLPPNYFEEHRRIHAFYDAVKGRFAETVEPLLPKGYYQLNFKVNSSIYNSETGKLRTTDELQVIATTICDAISKVSNKYNFLETGIKVQRPIYWYLHPQIDDGEETSSLKIFMEKDMGSLLVASEEREDLIISQFKINLSKANKKFEKYTDSLKILIIELCGDMFLIPSQSEIQRMLNSVNTKGLVDQVWVAQPYGESEQEIVYWQV